MATQYGVLSYILFDDVGLAVPCDIYVALDDTQTLATILGEFATYAALLDDITDGASNEAHLTLKFAATGMKTTPNTGVLVDSTGLFTFSQNDSIYKWSIDIPAIARAVISGSAIDTTPGGPVALWAAWFNSAHSGVRGVSKGKNNLTGFRLSKLTTRSHRKALNRLSTKKPSE